MFKSLQKKLLFIFLLLSSLSAGIILLHNNYIKKREKIDVADRTIDLIYTSNLYKFHLMADFFALETRNINFYKTGESHYFRKLDSINVSINKLFAVFKTNNEIKLDFELARIKRIMTAHDSIFNEVTKKIKLRGRSDYGIVGKMRKEVHKLERIKKLNLSLILTLRRHEKDYMLRYEKSYIDSVKKTIGRMKNHILQKNDLSRSDKESCLFYLNSYQNKFDTIVSLNKKIGIKDNTALFFKLNQIEAEIQNEFTDLTRKTFEAEADMHINLNYKFLIYSVLLILISILISYFFAIKVTKPISQLSKQMTRFVSNGFTNSEEPEIKANHKEIKDLMISFNILKYEIVDLLNNFKQKVEERTQTINKQNIELAELNTTKDKFFSIIAHDLKSPFTTLIGFSDILDKKFDKYDTEEKKKFIKIINKGIHTTYKLLENLLYWSQSQINGIKFNPQELDLYNVVNETKKILNQSAENKSIKLINEIPENIIVNADKDMLSVIIRNLTSNAIKFTPKGGQIKLQADLSIHSNGQDFVEIKITDTGVGISKETQLILFDIGKDTSTKGTENESGTGLGLILCKEFVDKHGGKIWVESEEDKGSTFSFTIPVKLKAKEPNAKRIW